MVLSDTSESLRKKAVLELKEVPISKTLQRMRMQSQLWRKGLVSNKTYMPSFSPVIIF